MTERCIAVIWPGNRYGDTPEPPEYCDQDAAEGSELCEAHLAAAEAGDYL